MSGQSHVERGSMESSRRKRLPPKESAPSLSHIGLPSECFHLRLCLPEPALLAHGVARSARE